MTDEIEKLDYWNKLDIKLPKINEGVYILRVDFSIVRLAKLQIYDKENAKIQLRDTDVSPIKNGDIYWSYYVITGEVKYWANIEIFPYWMEPKDLLKIVAPPKNPENREEVSRADLIDLED
jgi:hypothetical protein